LYKCSNSCLWCSCWWNLDFSFKSYGKESLYKYCMNVDDGRIMRSSAPRAHDMPIVNIHTIFVKTFFSTIYHYIINSCAKSAWYARRQHSYNICKDSCLLYNDILLKRKSLQILYECWRWAYHALLAQLFIVNTDRKTINSNNCAKFEVNWPRGSQFTAWHTKNCLKITYNLMNKVPYIPALWDFIHQIVGDFSYVAL
jgi:hypothetical protein